MLDQPVSLMDALMEFAEKVSKAAKLKKREQVARKLELSLRKAFREQGKLFVKGLSKYKDRFSETAQAVLPSHFGNDKQIVMQEAIPATEWMFIFYDAAQKTTKLFSKPVDETVKAALAQGAATTIADMGMNISFDLANPRAVTYLENYGAKLVTNINETTRDYLNTILTQAANEGWSYDKTAQAIIDRYSEFEVGSPLQHIDSRAHLIAVTETGNAMMEGTLQVAQDLQAAGIEMEKYWSQVTGYDDDCAKNEAAGWIPIDQPFPSGDMRPLAHPGCVCDMLTRVKQ